ncbi:MAG: hypothetical protein ABI728_04440 [Betaproteobacteria bacterium]
MDEQLKHYSSKLAYEIDSWDLKVALESGERVTVIDTRSPQAFDAEQQRLRMFEVVRTEPLGEPAWPCVKPGSGQRSGSTRGGVWQLPGGADRIRAMVPFTGKQALLA